MHESIYPLSFPVEGEGKVRFGMKAQGCLPFVQRSVADGQGWKQIAKNIGWVAFSAMQEYTSTSLSDFLSENGLLIDSCNRKPFFGFALYDPETRSIDIKRDRENNSDPGSMFQALVVCAQFIATNKTVFDQGPITSPEIYMKNDSEPRDMVFHAYLRKRGVETIISDRTYNGAIEKIAAMLQCGHILISSLFFDLVDIDNAQKAFVPDLKVEKSLFF
jgi:hypothetical protein